MQFLFWKIVGRWEIITIQYSEWPRVSRVSLETSLDLYTFWKYVFLNTLNSKCVYHFTTCDGLPSATHEHRWFPAHPAKHFLKSVIVIFAEEDIHFGHLSVTKQKLIVQFREFIFKRIKKRSKMYGLSRFESKRDHTSWTLIWMYRFSRQPSEKTSGCKWNNPCCIACRTHEFRMPAHPFARKQKHRPISY